MYRAVRVFFAVALSFVLVVPPTIAQNVKTAKDEHLGHGWDYNTSHTECGGLRRDGKPQAPCKPKPATYMGPALGDCPKGTFLDIGLWQCISCDKSKGFERTAAAADTERACARPATWQEANKKVQFRPAIKVGDLCPGPTATLEKAFYDSIRGGECWSCPKGYKTNVLPHVEAQDKCSQESYEDFRRPTRLFNTPWPHDCKPGQFHDVWDGGACWQCPAGFTRNGNHVNGTNACSRLVVGNSKPATRRGLGICPAGLITDPQNNGECWRCPEEYDRVLAHPISAPNACETTPGLVFSRATFVTPLTCPAGQDFDFFAVDNTLFNKLKAAGLTAPKAKAAPDRASCWKCPDNHKRTFAPVYNHDACQGETTEWYSAPFGEPGMFRLDGATDVVLEIMRDDRKLVDEAIKEFVNLCALNTADAEAAAACKRDPAKEMANMWKDLIDKPDESPILISMLLGRIGLAATAGVLKPDADVRPVTAADKRLMKGFADYVQKRRIYVADEGMKAFDAWRASVKYWEDFISSNSTSSLSAANKGPDLTNAKPIEETQPPPDWHQMVEAAMIGSVTAGAVLAGGAIVATFSIPKLSKKILPYAAKRAESAIRKSKVDKAIGEGIEKVVAKTTQTVAKKAASKAATQVLKLLKAAGPAFVIAVVIEVFVETVTKMDEYGKTDRGHLLTMQAHARQPVDLRREFLSTEGQQAMEGYWVMAVSGISDPDALTWSKIKAYAAGQTPETDKLKLPTSGTTTVIDGGSQPVTSIPKPSNNELAGLSLDNLQWEQISGRAHDIAVATDGTAWVIGDNKLPGGRGIYFRGPKDKDWGSLPGGAVRIAVVDTTPWLVNDGGIAFERTGTTWANRPVLAGGKIMKAVDVGASAKGVWAVAEPTKQGSHAVYRWTGKQWTRDQSAWGTRITVDRDGNPWLTNAAGQIFALINGKWQPFNGTAQDIAVDGFGAPAVVDAKGKVQIFNPATNNWVATDRDGTAVAIGGGKIWHLGPKTEVYRQK
tara:strand:+ start:3660 stop:6668 length:3009 start_codon:yes stop_codon:yes gene_type:complete